MKAASTAAPASKTSVSALIEGPHSWIVVEQGGPMLDEASGDGLDAGVPAKVVEAESIADRVGDASDDDEGHGELLLLKDGDGDAETQLVDDTVVVRESVPVAKLDGAVVSVRDPEPVRLAVVQAEAEDEMVDD